MNEVALRRRIAVLLVGRVDSSSSKEEGTGPSYGGVDSTGYRDKEVQSA
jgi:hypothetical protein